MLHRLILWLAVSLFCTGWTTFGAQSFVAFGLTNTTLGNANIDTNPFPTYYINTLGVDGTDGVSIDLGQADSGVFVYPDTISDPITGSFMEGKLYGSVNGETNRLIGSMRCSEQGDGYHPVTIDFSALGPVHLTFQAFRRGQLIGESGPQPGQMVVYGTYFTPYFPRVNPFWRMRDGTVGALIDFMGDAALSLPGGQELTADRIFIRADSPTNVVDFASRLEVTAKLPYFHIYDTRLGVFRRPHRVLGNAHLHAQPGMLRVANLSLDGEDGVVMELDGLARFDLGFAPIQLNTNEQLNLLVSGNPELGQGMGSARLARPGASLELSALLDNTSNQMVVVLSNGVGMGTATGTNVAVPAAATVVGCEVHARLVSGQPAIVMRLGQAVVVALPDQSSVQGDEIRFVGNGPSVLLSMLALTSTGLEEFTIVSETEHLLPSPELQIMYSDHQLELSWVDPYRMFGLEAKGTLEETFYSLGAEPTFVGDRATVIFQVVPEYPGTGIPYSGRAFFRLSSSPALPPND